MPIGILSPLPRLQIFGPDGHVLDGGFIYTYAAGTTTPIATYNDKDLAVANDNPIEVSASGVAPAIYLDPDIDYKFVCTTSTGALVWTQDHIFVNAEAALVRTATLAFTFDNGGSVIAAGMTADLEVPADCTITHVTMLADQAGSAVADIKKSTYTDFSTGLTSIVGAAPPTLAAEKSKDSTLTGWTPDLLIGDVLRVSVTSASTITRLQIQLQVTL